jgi:hypothetical protein
MCSSTADSRLLSTVAPGCTVWILSNSLKSSAVRARLGRDAELGALKRLDKQARLVERCALGPPVEDLIAEEGRLSHSYGGRSVFGWAPLPALQTLSDRERLRDGKIRNSAPTRALGH